MGQGETSRDRAMRLLQRIRERTEHTQQPVVVTDLVGECRLSTAEAHAAWKYLADHSLIDKFGIPYTAQINAKGIDLLDSRAAAHSGDGHLKAGSSTAIGFGRKDSAEDLARALEVSKELARLHAFLPQLTDSELSAYSTKSLPIGTFLQSKGQTFSVLTEDMLANEFKEELDRRKKDTTYDQWKERLKNSPIVAALLISSAVIVGVATLYGKLKPILPAPEASEPRWTGTWVGQLLPSPCGHFPPTDIKTVITVIGRDSFEEVSYTPGNTWGPFDFSFKGRTAHSARNDTTYTLTADEDSMHVDSRTPCQIADLKRETDAPSQSVASVPSGTTPTAVPLTASARVESDSLRPSEKEPAVATAFDLQIENDGSAPEEHIRIHVRLAGILRLSSTTFMILPVHKEFDPTNTAGLESPAESVTQDSTTFNELNYGWNIPVLAPHQKARYRIWYHKAANTTMGFFDVAIGTNLMSFSRRVMCDADSVECPIDTPILLLEKGVDSRPKPPTLTRH
jgi:hypothetical protein